VPPDPRSLKPPLGSVPSACVLVSPLFIKSPDRQSLQFDEELLERGGLVRVGSGSGVWGVCLTVCVGVASGPPSCVVGVVVAPVARSRFALLF